jgi:hypothetical protein
MRSIVGNPAGCGDPAYTSSGEGQAERPDQIGGEGGSSLDIRHTTFGPGEGAAFAVDPSGKTRKITNCHLPFTNYKFPLPFFTVRSQRADAGPVPVRKEPRSGPEPITPTSLAILRHSIHP